MIEQILKQAKAAGWSCREHDGELLISFPDGSEMSVRPNARGRKFCLRISGEAQKILNDSYDLHTASGCVFADTEETLEYLKFLEPCLLRTKACKEIEALQKELEKRGETEARAETMVRRGQEALRKLLLAERRACEISGVVLGELLVASHIVPWAECESARERLDLENVLLLAKNWDALFDAHLISFDSRTGALVKSERLSDGDFRALTGREATDAAIRISVNTDARRAYLRAHLDSLRKKDAEEA